MSHSSSVFLKLSILYMNTCVTAITVIVKYVMGVKSMWEVAVKRITSTGTGHWLNAVPECLGGKYMSCDEQ